MKTIKTKKSVGKAYVFWDRHFTNSSRSLIALEADRVKSQESGYKCSEISEVELFETVEEQVPEVVARWYFAYIRGESSDMYITTIDDNEWLEKKRARLIKEGYLCSEIKLLREEF
jgi:hypothetical protein